MPCLLCRGKFCTFFVPSCPALLPEVLSCPLGGMLSALPACLSAWPVFSHCQHLLDSNSKHGNPLGSPFLPVPRENTFQMEHKCASHAGLSAFCLGTTEQDVVTSAHTAQVFSLNVLPFSQDNGRFLLRTKYKETQSQGSLPALCRKGHSLAEAERQSFEILHAVCYVLALIFKDTGNIPPSRGAGEAAGEDIWEDRSIHLSFPLGQQQSPASL